MVIRKLMSGEAVVTCPCPADARHGGIGFLTHVQWRVMLPHPEGCVCSREGVECGLFLKEILSVSNAPYIFM